MTQKFISKPLRTALFGWQWSTDCLGQRHELYMALILADMNHAIQYTMIGKGNAKQNNQSAA